MAIKNVQNQKNWMKHSAKPWFLILITLGIIVFVLTRISNASEIETLLNKLVEKGVLTAAEAQQILVETREEERKKIAQQKHDILPEWVQKTKLTGDFRLREQYEKKNNGEDRWRTRIRYRLGIESQVLDKFKVGFGLASGGSDPRSTNETLKDSFSSKEIRLDYAFGQYDPFKWLTLVGGKFKNPLFNPADLIWDTDITTEGGAAQFRYPVSDSLGLFANIGFFILDERHTETKPPKKNRQDPLMYVVQPGFELKIKDSDQKDFAKIKASVAYYGFSQVKNNVMDYTSKTNTLDEVVVNKKSYKFLKYDYDALVMDTQIGFMPQGFIVPYFGLLGQFVYNPDPEKGNTGWLVGGIFGSEKVSEKGQWQLRYMYRRLERDAVLDCLPDSDFLGGATDVRGHEAIFEYGLHKNISVSLDYYNTQRLHDPEHENLLQLDWNLKF